MKPRNREINIFNLSMLDVISGAMGAFLIVMVVLFPYYKKEPIDYQREIRRLTEEAHAAQEAARHAQAEAARAEQARRQAEQTQQQTEQARRQAEQARQQAEAEAQENRQRAETAQKQLAKTFLVVHIMWDTQNQDVDLHVVNPSGAEFYYERRTQAGHPGILSVDSQRGPGNEVWELHNAPPGDYRVYANLYALHGENRTPTVTSAVIHRDGSTRLPNVQLTQIGRKMPIATITVKPDGSVSVR